VSGAYDAVVVGAGPNGLAAAVTLAEAGCTVLVLEQADEIGGGSRSGALTLPGFVHDICSAIHPLGLASPFFRRQPLAAHGLEWIQPEAPVAHPFDAGPAFVAEQDLARTAAALGEDGPAYRALFGPLVTAAPALVEQFMGPLRPPRHPLVSARFGQVAVRSANALARARFRGEPARALLAGNAAHSILPLDSVPSAAPGLLLGLLAHAAGWPIPRSGSQAIPDALAGRLRALGGTIETSTPVHRLEDLPPARAVLLDVSPNQLVAFAGDRLPPRYRRALERFRHGPAAFKVDYALDGPIPWADPACARAGTVHLGGTLAEIVHAEQDAFHGRHPERPFVILAQQSLFDDSRAPAGRHTAWAYCHVPNGSTVDMTDRISAQIERFAPGFRDRVLSRHVHSPATLEAYNPNYVGGDISGGAMTLKQLFLRPTARVIPYTTPLDGVYLCSASTPPGGGVHGMCGWWAARTALRRM
jgi:phytoene dehydrogenase-like protein